MTMLHLLTLISLPQLIWGQVVNAPDGLFIGKTVRDGGKPINAFLGIPYAKPPLGDLRFRKPQPLERSLFGVIRATKLAPACPQFSNNPYPFYDNSSKQSEDCLYLNIWAPAGLRLFKLPVMFWIHGGGFFISSSRLPFFDGRTLANRGNVIVVTINYRLQAFGFLYSGSDDAPGNVGIYDMIEALKWVNKNIESFGGDKNSITLFGQSAGGISIGMFTVSPLTRGQGLFKRIIMQSGTPTNMPSGCDDLDYNSTQKVAEALGCSNDDVTLENNPSAVVNCLRGIEAERLARVFIEVNGNGRPVYPRCHSDFLPSDPRVAIINGDFEPVDVFIGSNNGDGSLLITEDMQDVFGFFGQKYPQINYTFGEYIIQQNFPNNSQSVIDQYLGNVDENEYDRIRYEIFTARGDYQRTCPSIYFAESFARKDPNIQVHNYFFTHPSSNAPWATWMLAVHFEETPFVFGYPLRHPKKYSKEELRLSERMITAWSSFARTGNPTDGNESWPRYSRGRPLYKNLNFSDPWITEEGPHLNNCNFFRPQFGFP